MRIHLVPGFLIWVLLPASGQAPRATLPGLAKDPQAIMTAAAPFYDFNAADLKPWHLKASYQLYDETGKPTEQGTYEYWWASPTVYRSSWIREGTAHSDWHTADGKHEHSKVGSPLDFFEYKLQEALLSPIPRAADLDPAKSRLAYHTLKVGGAELPCVMVIPHMKDESRFHNVQLGLFNTYCFNEQLPALRVSYSFGTVVEEFNKIAKFQNRFMPEDVTFVDGKREVLTATVDQLNGISASDPAFVPAPDATESKVVRVEVPSGVSAEKVLKKVPPVYPQEDKSARITGVVVLQATIGQNGAIRELRVLDAPSPSLAAASLAAVSHWQYKPYILFGEPVQVETTINVIFSMSQ